MIYSSVHKALAQSVQSQLQSMVGVSLLGVEKNSIRVRKVPWTSDFGTMDLSTGKIAGDKTFSWPAILVCYFDLETFNPLAGVNIRDDIEYPITVVFVQPNNTPGTVAAEDGDDQFLRWREAVERTYTHLRGITSSGGLKGYLDVTANNVNYTFHNCTTKPGTIFDWNRWKPDGMSLDFGWLMLSFTVRRPGGA